MSRFWHSGCFAGKAVMRNRLISCGGGGRNRTGVHGFAVPTEEKCTGKSSTQIFEPAIWHKSTTQKWHSNTATKKEVFMTRLTNNDRRFGPLTYARSSWNPLRIVFSTGGGEENHPHNHLTCYAFGRVARLDLPTRIKPWRRWVDTSGYEWSRGPGSGYWDTYPKEYGFSLHDGFFQLFLGAQTHDSVTTKSWSTHLPWTQWRHIRMSLYDTRGKHFWTEWSRPRGFAFRDDWEARQAVEKACPKVVFEFDDYDGQRIQVTTHIQEREWHFGEGCFRWLSLFRKPLIKRSLDLEFSDEVGPEKGSWKGGTLGHSIEMLPGETHEAAFRRYCDQEHRSKYRPFRISFVGAVLKSVEQCGLKSDSCPVTM